MSTWEIELASSLFALLDGGTAGLVWGYLICWIGYALVFASIAEMASMYGRPELMGYLVSNLFLSARPRLVDNTIVRPGERSCEPTSS